eukprot:TRINITY_DN12713_c0_g1_i1.p1 TRINITY_DN12713_c0_g1~~TRINITY_DN12713_c0_g1_i1.p1  ORF type:complete len:375 (-),score=68.75 TRINITY_DN12713_c0_g1_i1:72-1163(-)
MALVDSNVFSPSPVASEFDSLTRNRSPLPSTCSSPVAVAALAHRPPPVTIQLPSPRVLFRNSTTADAARANNDDNNQMQSVDVAANMCGKASDNNAVGLDDVESVSLSSSRIMSPQISFDMHHSAPLSTRGESASSVVSTAWQNLWIDNKLLRGVSHTIFCCVFSSSYLLSVLPRVLVALDVFITIGLMIHFESQKGSVPFDNLLAWLQHSDFDVVLLAVLRAIVLFQCYSYKFHTNFVAISACWTTSGLSALFVSMKVVYLHEFPKRLIFLLTNLSLICLEHCLYVMTKRRKIRVAAAKLQNKELSSMSDFGDQANVVYFEEDGEDPGSPDEHSRFTPKLRAGGVFSEYTIVDELGNMRHVA